MHVFLFDDRKVQFENPGIYDINFAREIINILHLKHFVHLFKALHQIIPKKIFSAFTG